MVKFYAIGVRSSRGNRIRHCWIRMQTLTRERSKCFWRRSVCVSHVDRILTVKAEGRFWSHLSPSSCRDESSSCLYCCRLNRQGIRKMIPDALRSRLSWRKLCLIVVAIYFQRLVLPRSSVFFVTKNYK